MTDFHILIPARLASTRLPNKPLVKIAGRALVLRVLDCALKAGAQSVHVATDSDRVAALIESEGGRVVKTSSTHRSGTDRLAEAAEDRKSTRLNSSHVAISYAVFCLKKKKNNIKQEGHYER